MSEIKVKEGESLDSAPYLQKFVRENITRSLL